jgi:hypothetical protein
MRLRGLSDGASADKRDDPLFLSTDVHKER